MLTQGTANADMLNGGAGDDTIFGNGGADTITGGLGADRLSGGAGADLFKFAQGDSTLANPDQITDFETGDRLDFGLVAATEANTIGLAANSLSEAKAQASAAFAANSALRYAGVMVGANAHIFASDADGGQAVTMVTLVNPGASLSLASITGSTPVNPNLFAGTDGAETLTGTAGSDTILGNGGADTITGGLGADRLSGGAGADLFKFAQGDSTLANPDQITDFETGDRLDFGLVAATEANTIGLAANSLSEAKAQASAAFAANSALRYAGVMVGANAHIFASDADGGQAVTMVTLVNPGASLSLASITGSTPVNPNLFAGTDGAETLTGTAGSDTILGNGGADTITGGLGADRLSGGAGADLFKFAQGDSTLANPDQITDFETGDRLDFGLVAATEANTIGLAANSLSEAKAQASAAFAANSALRYAGVMVGANAHIFASDADGGQAVTMVTLINPGASLSLASITGSTPVNPNLFAGTDGAETLTGTAGSDTILGNGGADTITGGLGADRLSGGAGADLFKFAQGDSTLANPDQITDFETGDRLDFGLVQGTATNYVENSAASLAAATTQANAAFGANVALRYVATQVGSDVQLLATDADGGETHSLVTLKNITTANIDFTNILGSAPPPTNPYLIVGTEGADTLAGTAAPETINGLGDADTITGGGSVDVLSGGSGDDLFKFAAGDSVYAASTPTTIASYGDKILDFEGGTRGTGVAGGSGDRLDFGLTLGLATNYVENSAATVDAARVQAENVFGANSALRYIATQVGADVVLFTTDSDGGETHSLVTLQGVSTSTIDFNNIVGTAPPPVNPDLIVGTEGPEVLNGTSGNDTIQGLGGADTIIGGAGVDVLNGGAGDDLFQFPIGSSPVGAPDRIVGFNGGTRADGTAGGTGDLLNLSSVESTSNNYFESPSSDATAALALANGVFTGTLNTRYVAVQVGADVHVFANSAPGGNAVTDVLLTGTSLANIGFNNIVGAPVPPDPHVINGGENADTLVGTATADTIQGLGGPDTITGGQGADLLTGGSGNDLFKFVEGDSTPANPDQITDFATSDRLDFGIVQGTAGNYFENSAASLAAAKTQANVVFAANSALRYVATQVGSDVQLFATDADGGETHSLVTLQNLTTEIIDFVNVVGSAAPPVDPYLIVGTDSAEPLAGTAAPETMYGLLGADTITGGGGVDVLGGGGGNDYFRFMAGDSVYAASTPTTIASYGDKIIDFEGGTRGTGVAGGTGDRLDFGFAQGTATNYLENTAATKEAAVTQAASAFAGSVGLRYVATQVGSDVLVFASSGGQIASVVTLAGADVGALGFLNIAGTAPSNNQILDGTEGRDTLIGGTSNDVLAGFADSDSLAGGAGNDTLLGGDGQDTLIGGLGNDRLSGGANEDRFVFGPGDSGQFFSGVITPGTADIVTDFQTGIDVLTFGMGAAIATPGSGNYTELSTLFTTYANAEATAQTTFSAQPSLIYVVTQVGSDTYVFVDTGGTTDADSIIYLQGVALSGIAAADIV